jgi:hypothetical protein
VGATEGYVLLAVGLILLVVVVFVSFTLLQRFRQRRLQELRGDSAGPQASRDRAYNRLVLARREADLWAAQGGDVEQARQLIDLSKRSLDAGGADRAYELAQAAHETLVRARREPAPRRPAASKPETSPSPLPGGSPASGGSAPLDAKEAAPAPSVPKNRAEAQFQLRLFEEELAVALKDAKRRAKVKGARELYVQAHAAFAGGDYSQAFRLALRGRRQIGGHVETLGPPPATPVPGGAVGLPPTADAAESAEQVAALERCPLCGHPTVAGDTFCRGCGAARTPASCAHCGAPRSTTDTFCGRCGERYG